MSNKEETLAGNDSTRKANDPTPAATSPMRTSAIGDLGNAGTMVTDKDIEDRMKEAMRLARDEKKKMDGVIEDLDEKLNDVLSQQEFEYLKSYNIYVKRKEKDLRDLIEKLNLKNSNNTLKDDKIVTLEKTIQSYRDDQIRMEREKD